MDNRHLPASTASRSSYRSPHLVLRVSIALAFSGDPSTFDEVPALRTSLPASHRDAWFSFSSNSLRLRCLCIRRYPIPKESFSCPIPRLDTHTEYHTALSSSKQAILHPILLHSSHLCRHSISSHSGGCRDSR